MKKNGQYPQKKTINLVIKEKSQFNPGRLIPLLAAVLLAAAAFGKFAVADRMAEVNRAQAALDAAGARAKELTAAIADYDAVQDEYNRYASGWMTEDETALVDRMATIDLIERELMSVGGVKQFALAGNTLSVDLTGVTLSGTSGIVERLYAYPMVLQVEVYTAATGQISGDGALVSLAITLVSGAPQTEGGEA